MYDYIHTLPMEINAVWSSKASGTAFIFLMNRYSYGVGLILELVTGSPGSASDKRYVRLLTFEFSFQILPLTEICRFRCRVVAQVSLWFTMISLVTTSRQSPRNTFLFTHSSWRDPPVLFALRVYAICGQSKLILCVALIMIAVRFGVDVWVGAPCNISSDMENSQIITIQQDNVLTRGVSTTGSQFGLFSMCSSIALNALLYERWEWQAHGSGTYCCWSFHHFQCRCRYPSHPVWPALSLSSDPQPPLSLQSYHFYLTPSCSE